MRSIKLWLWKLEVVQRLWKNVFASYYWNLRPPVAAANLCRKLLHRAPEITRRETITLFWKRIGSLYRGSNTEESGRSVGERRESFGEPQKHQILPGFFPKIWNCQFWKMTVVNTHLFPRWTFQSIWLHSQLPKPLPVLPAVHLQPKRDLFSYRLGKLALSATQ